MQLQDENSVKIGVKHKRPDGELGEGESASKKEETVQNGWAGLMLLQVCLCAEVEVYVKVLLDNTIPTFTQHIPRCIHTQTHVHTRSVRAFEERRRKLDCHSTDFVESYYTDVVLFYRGRATARRHASPTRATRTGFLVSILLMSRGPKSCSLAD